jgi:hypothetical protein
MYELKVYEIICPSIARCQVYDRVFVRWTSMPAYAVSCTVDYVTASVDTSLLL